MPERYFFHSGIHIDAVKAFLSKNNVTLIVEVIAPIFDPHIIEYSEPKIVLLDIVLNNIDPGYMVYQRMVQKALEFGMDYKKIAAIKFNWSGVELLKWRCDQYDSFDESGKPFEGYVFRDRRNYMFKLKTAYYRKWKQYRWQASKLLSGQPVPFESDPFLSWVEQNKADMFGKSIIDMRNTYEKTHTTQL